MFKSPHRYYFNSPALQKPVVELPTLNSVKPFTGVAQRKRARLITSRTPDRNGSPVLFQFAWFAEPGRHMLSDVKHSNHLTGMAQRQRAGLIILRSLDRDELPVFFQFASFIEAGRHSLSDVKQHMPYTGVAHRQRAGLITLR